MPHDDANGRSSRRLGRALIVEDDPLLALGLEMALRDGGAREVVVCHGIADAFAALESLRPEILVLDVQLADRNDGWAIAELATTLSPRPPRIVFSTGQPESIPKAVAALGVVLAKPYSPERLVAVLSQPRRKAGLLGRLRGALVE